MSIPLFLPVSILGITAIIDFMDGLNGLVTGFLAVAVASVAFAFAFRLGSILRLLVCSLLAFLCWNWSPANVFMGDVGSTFLGSFYAGSMLQAAELGAGLGLLLLISPLIADAAEPSAIPQWPFSRAFANEVAPLRSGEEGLSI